MTEENKSDSDSDLESVGVIEIVIKYDCSTNQVSIAGPMGDGLMFLGLLEMAKVSFMETRSQTTRSPIIAPVDLGGPFGPRNIG